MEKVIPRISLRKREHLALILGLERCTPDVFYKEIKFKVDPLRERYGIFVDRGFVESTLACLGISEHRPAHHNSMRHYHNSLMILTFRDRIEDFIRTLQNNGWSGPRWEVFAYLTQRPLAEEFD